MEVRRKAHGFVSKHKKHMAHISDNTLDFILSS